VIVVAVRWYLRYSLSYRDVEELLAERGIEVDHAAAWRTVWLVLNNAPASVASPSGEEVPDDGDQAPDPRTGRDRHTSRMA
jgi:hypothetical protein